MMFDLTSPADSPDRPPEQWETTIRVYFSRDHEEIDGTFHHLLQELKRAAADPDHVVKTAELLFDEFDERLERHIRLEEEILFPAVERKAPHLAQGPGRVMRMEHEQIRKLKSDARDYLRMSLARRGSLEHAVSSLESVLAVLLDHNGKEEAVYYPMSERLFTPTEMREMLSKIQRIG